MILAASAMTLLFLSALACDDAFSFKYIRISRQLQHELKVDQFDVKLPKVFYALSKTVCHARTHNHARIILIGNNKGNCADVRQCQF